MASSKVDVSDYEKCTHNSKKALKDAQTLHSCEVDILHCRDSFTVRESNELACQIIVLLSNF